MTAEPTRRVVRALTRQGATVRFCGGAVRDALLGVAVADIDLATPDPPEVVAKLAAEAGLSTHPTGIAHGTVTIVADRRPYEVTTLRQDVETFGRKARVAFTGDWRADAARRDFTINALYADPDGTLHDYFDGRADLAAGRVRFIGDARERVREDALRLLRFFRFEARFGQGEPDAEALAACRALAALAGGLSGERVRAELFRLLSGPRAPRAVRLMAEVGLLAVILPEAIHADRLEALVAAGEPGDPVLRLAALIEDGTAAQRLRLSNAEARRLTELSPPLTLAATADTRTHRRMLYAHEMQRVRDSAWLALAETGDPRYRGWIAAADAWTRPRLPVTGADARAAGIAPGPAMGAALRRVEDAWIDSDFSLDRAACLALLR